ncbi:unnamed protein product [Lactuca saligna]|uniref:Cell wall protein n=1 Tax=Lactuca saligna TaxID=75948 RepID=A0AA36E2U4_LACSI|nr:unnamed protein product [Lactuca saligna]
MAKIIQSVFLIILVSNLVIPIVIAIRDIPDKNLKTPEEKDVKHPETFFNYDRGYLIPGIGRGIKPKSKEGFNPFTYNPITGGNNGIPGVTVPSGGGNIPGYGDLGSSGSAGGSYLPGGDDTLVPSPEDEGPNPAPDSP